MKIRLNKPAFVRRISTHQVIGTSDILTHILDEHFYAVNKDVNVLDYHLYFYVGQSKEFWKDFVVWMKENGWNVYFWEDRPDGIFENWGIDISDNCLRYVEYKLTYSK